jgi:hypothetical protein
MSDEQTPHHLKDSVVLTTTVLKDKENQVLQKLDQRRQTLGQRFPLAFTLVGAFGLVATFYGFEGIINRVDFLYNNPIILLVVGIALLGVTGTLYKKLG